MQSERRIKKETDGGKKEYHRRKRQGAVTGKAGDELRGMAMERQKETERGGRRKGSDGWEWKRKKERFGQHPICCLCCCLGQRCFRPWGNFLILSQWVDGWHIFLITSLSVIDYSCRTPLPSHRQSLLQPYRAALAPNTVWTPEYRVCLFLSLWKALSHSVCPCNRDFSCKPLRLWWRKWIRAPCLIGKPSERSWLPLREALSLWATLWPAEWSRGQ